MVITAVFTACVYFFVHPASLHPFPPAQPPVVYTTRGGVNVLTWYCSDGDHCLLSNRCVVILNR